MKFLLFAGLLLVALTVTTADAAVLETRAHASFTGSVSFASASVIVADAAGQRTTVSMSDVARISFFNAPSSTTLTNALWDSGDIGDVFQTGSTVWTNGALALTASGWGLWRDADGLRFASVPVTGDGEIIARVGSFEDSDGSVLAGLSFRESLDLSTCGLHF
jgi:hypothetical protein